MDSNDFMREAIRLAIENVKKRGGPFGAVVVRDGQIIARGVNQVTATNDPTAHAEVMAIRSASTVLNNFNLMGCEIYSSCEPCPMCLGAIYWSRIDKVYFGAGKFDAAHYGFDDQMIEEEIKANPQDRLLPMVQLLSNEALLAFVEWENFVNKTNY